MSFLKRIIDLWRRSGTDSPLRDAAALVVLIMVIGTLGFALIEGWSIPDSLYATIITITTVGYGDMVPTSSAGRWFATIFTLFAIGAAGFTLTSLAAGLIEKQQILRQEDLRKKQMKRIAALENHVVICGGGYVGKRIAHQFQREGVPFVVVEPDEQLMRWTLLYLDDEYRTHRYKEHFDITYEGDISEHEGKDLAQLGEELKVPYVLDTPTNNAVLVRAGISRAKGLIAGMNDDRDNLLVVLSARELARELENNGLRIIARATDEENSKKLKMAGANQVFSPNFVEAAQLAANMLHPHTGAIWRMTMSEKEPLRFTEVHVDGEPDMIGKSCAEIKIDSGHLVMSIYRDGRYLNLPDPGERCQPGDVLIIITEKAYDASKHW
jgi:voltage-gated potassium channel